MKKPTLETLAYKRGERKALECRCGRIVEGLGSDIGAVTCWICTAKQSAPPIMPKQISHEVKEERPRGWQKRKEYVSPSGQTYSFGKEVSSNERTNRVDSIFGKKGSEKVVTSDAVEPKRKRGRPKGVRNKPKTS